MGIDKITDLSPDELEPEGVGSTKETKERNEPFESGELLRLGSLVESLRRIASSLSQREQEGLNPLIDERAIGSIRFTATRLEDFSSKKNDLEEVAGEISRLSSIFDSFGQVPKERVVRESTEMLKRLASQIRELGDVCLELKSLLGSKEKPEYQEIISGLNRIMIRGEKVWMWLRKKADILDGR